MSLHENNVPKVHYNTFLRHARSKYVKCLFANIQKQWNMLKIRIIFKKNPKFAGKNNSTFVRIKNAKFPKYYFWIDSNTYRELFKSTLAYLTLSSVNLSLDLNDGSILWLVSVSGTLSLYLAQTCPKLEVYQYWRCTYFSAKLAFIAKIFLILYFVHNRIKSTWK